MGRKLIYIRIQIAHIICTNKYDARQGDVELWQVETLQCISQVLFRLIRPGCYCTPLHFGHSGQPVTCHRRINRNSDAQNI